MNETSDESLRRLFAQAEPVVPEESFVAAVASQLVARRLRQRRLRAALAAAAVLAAVVVAAWLAPYAPLSWPVDVAATARQRAVQVPFYLYLVLAAAVLPLLGTVWLVRRR